MHSVRCPACPVDLNEFTGAFVISFRRAYKYCFHLVRACWNRLCARVLVASGPSSASAFFSSLSSSSLSSSSSLLVVVVVVLLLFDLRVENVCAARSEEDGGSSSGGPRSS